MFKALDHVNYDQLQLNESLKNDKQTKYKVEALTDISCLALNRHAALLPEAVKALPLHLVPKLLQTAVKHGQTDAIQILIANWPLKNLR